MQISKFGSKNNDLTPSIDRIDPKKGYVKENIIVVSMKANRIKTDATVEEIRKVADFYEKLLNNK
jgi:predicted RND superfamily exporter protein